jgi:hypothetical protein
MLALSYGGRWTLVMDEGKESYAFKSLTLSSLVRYTLSMSATTTRLEAREAHSEVGRLTLMPAPIVAGLTQLGTKGVRGAEHCRQ